MENNKVYYTIVNKDKIKVKKNVTSKENIETIQSQYVLYSLLNHFKINKCQISRTNMGKPYFKGLNIHFNYSHSINYIACAISYYKVGIDIENIDRDISDAVIKICQLNSKNKLEEFVKKEAYCKLVGVGIAMIFDNNNFKNINKENKTIVTKNYICSIYSDCLNPIFEYIDIL